MSASGKRANILVTGGAGFVGSHLCRALLDCGHRVTAVDNLYTGSKKNIKDLALNQRFKFIKYDIVKPLTLRGIDQIYHLACPASPRHYQADPVATMRTSVLGTWNMLDLARRTRAKLLFSSTSEIYGDPLEHPQKETYWGNVNPVGLRSCYDEGKRCAETLCMDYRRQYGVDVRIVRIFNTYGPFMHPDDGRVVSNFIVQALQGVPLTIYGKGQQTRSFQYIDDLVRGICKAMAVRKLERPVNIGNPNEFTILQLAKKVLQFVPSSKSVLVFKSLPSDDPKQRKPDISLAKEVLDWKPLVSLDEGLQKTVQYFQSVIS
jgi:UDP-glucuronate decarboxylase